MIHRHLARVREYDRWLRAPSISSMVYRWLAGPHAVLLVNTPVTRVPELVNLQPKHRVLDLGGGRGAVARFLAGRIPFHQPVIAIEPSEAMLGLARRDLEGRNVELVHGLATHLPLASESVDLIIAAHLFKHLDDGQLYIAFGEAKRVLRPGGILLAWDFAPTSSRRLNRFHLWLLQRGVGRQYLRGHGQVVEYAWPHGWGYIERPDLRPFLFPPMPRTVALLQKSRDPDFDRTRFGPWPEVGAGSEQEPSAGAAAVD